MRAKENKRSQAMAKKAFMATVRNIQGKNVAVSEETVLQDVTNIVEEVREGKHTREK